MARIDLAPEVGEDFARIPNYLEEHQSPQVSSTVETIIGAIDLLQDNPLIGRPGPSGHRELIIGHRRSGYIALY